MDALRAPIGKPLTVVSLRKNSPLDCLHLFRPLRSELVLLPLLRFASLGISRPVGDGGIYFAIVVVLLAAVQCLSSVFDISLSNWQVSAHIELSPAIAGRKRPTFV